MSEQDKFLLDGHVHTLECGHAYSTITEIARAAKEKGLEMVCWTEHGPKLPNATSPTFFSNMRVLPPYIEGVRVLRGIEANILDTNGKIDLYKYFAPHMEIVSASLHGAPFKPGKSVKENTDALIGAAFNENVDFLCHTGNPTYPIDKEAVVKAAKESDTMIEVNNSSFFVRRGSTKNCYDIAKLCAEYGVPIIVGTDAHWAGDVGDFTYAKKTLEHAGVPKELIVNYEPQKLIDYLEKKGRRLGHTRKEEGVEPYREFEEELLRETGESDVRQA